MSISGPLLSWFSDRLMEMLTQRMAGMPSSACQVSKSLCQSKPRPRNAGLRLSRD